MRFSLFFLLAGLAAATSVGPPKGSVVVVGGGTLGPDVLNRFIDLAGGPEAPIVLIPTANGIDPEPANLGEENILRKAGMKHITILHTTDRRIANSKEFVAPLQNARGVWIAGGRQWRLVDSYLNTRTVRELRALLPRGGVIGGSSAGANILSSYAVRGARSGNTIMMAPGYERGFGFLRDVAIDQHLLTRKRQNDRPPWSCKVTGSRWPARVKSRSTKVVSRTTSSRPAIVSI
jgi:cyanophycinase